MSYIRCLSNSEGLYVWEDTDGMVHWNTALEKEHLMPTMVFEGLMTAWDKDGDILENDPLVFKTAKIYESNADWKIVIEYDDWQIRLWPVTFHYIFNQWKRTSWKHHVRQLCRIMRWKLLGVRYAVENLFVKR
jgi:hypothetical protein